MGGWTFVVNFLFPIPLISLLILCLPLPDFIATPIRKLVNFVLSKILFAPLINGLNLYQLSTLLSLVLFLDATWSTMKTQEKMQIVTRNLGQTDNLLCTKWRNERNFWIAFLSLVLWLILYRVHKLTKDLERYKAAIRAEDKPHDD